MKTSGIFGRSAGLSKKAATRHNAAVKAWQTRRASTSSVATEKPETALTSTQVIEAFVNADSPAKHKSATKKLNTYAAAKVLEGKDEKQVIAAIKAHVTRRLKAVRV